MGIVGGGGSRGMWEVWSEIEGLCGYDTHENCGKCGGGGGGPRGGV